MKFLVDAHLPRKLAIQLKDMGYDTRHTLGLPLGNRTTDQFINELSIAEQRLIQQQYGKNSGGLYGVSLHRIDA